MKLATIAKTFAVATLVVGASLFINAKITANRGHKSQSFVITYQEKRILYGGVPYVEGFKTHVEKSNGEFRVTRYFLSGAPAREFVSVASGAYEIKEDGIKYFGPQLPEDTRRRYFDESWLANNSALVRTEKVAGLNAYVMHTSESGDQWTEEYYSPLVGPTVLKRVAYGGQNTYYILEAINVQFQDVDHGEVQLPDLPKIE